MSRFSQPSRGQIQEQLRQALQRQRPTEIAEEEDENTAEENAEDAEEDEGNGDLQEPLRRSHDPFKQGTIILEEPNFRVKVKSVDHIRRTRYMLMDHLYSMWIEQKRRGQPPLLLDLERGIEAGLIRVLEELKSIYSFHQQYQIYVTIISKDIKSGLNSGNYSLQTPSDKIARWMLAMLYNYLKSKQTLRLNKSFKIQIKVLSVHHTENLERNNPRFRRHIYH